jgi:flagellar biosynthetic protein FliO
MTETGIDTPSLMGSLALSFVSLGVVCLLAYIALRWLSRRGVGGVQGPIRVVARCPIEQRRTLVVVRVAGRCFLLGVGEGPMTMLAELDHAAFPEKDPPSSGGGKLFSEVLRGIHKRSFQPSQKSAQVETDKGDVR